MQIFPFSLFRQPLSLNLLPSPPPPPPSSPIRHPSSKEGSSLPRLLLFLCLANFTGLWCQKMLMASPPRPSSCCFCRAAGGLRELSTSRLSQGDRKSGLWFQRCGQITLGAAARFSSCIQKQTSLALMRINCLPKPSPVWTT